MEESASGLAEGAGSCARGKLLLLRGPRGREGKKGMLGRAEIAGLKMFSFLFFFSQNQTNKFNSNSNSKI